VSEECQEREKRKKRRQRQKRPRVALPPELERYRKIPVLWAAELKGISVDPVWFERTDGLRATPKENVAWFWWERPSLRFPPPPLVLYARSRPAKRRDHYDADADIRGSVAESFRAIKQRKHAGGPGWLAGGDNSRIVTIRRGSQAEEG